MFNRKRTLEVFGYDIDPNIRRRTVAEIEATKGVVKKNLKVVDNCPKCDEERKITLRASRHNRPCYKCFHNSPKMIEAKKNKTKEVSDATKRKMRQNHWSKKGIASPFKGKKHTEKAKQILAKKASIQEKQAKLKLGEEEYKIRMSLIARGGLPREEFDGFTSPESVKIRHSDEGKAWRREVLAKADFTCIKCKERGGSLHAHHKNAFASFPEQRFDVNNGACLCDACHADFHSAYGKGNNTKEQFEEWLCGAYMQTEVALEDPINLVATDM